MQDSHFVVCVYKLALFVIVLYLKKEIIIEWMHSMELLRECNALSPSPSPPSTDSAARRLNWPTTNY